MKLSCLQENLYKGLSIVNHIASSNTALPILSNVLLQVKKGILNLITTNLEIGIRSTIRGKIEKEGDFTVSAQLLTNYINFLPTNQPVNLETINNVLHLKCKNHQTKIKGISAEEFPLFPKVEKENKYSCKMGELKKGIQQVISTVTPGDTRPEISGVLFGFNYFQNGKLTLAGTDSYRLAEKNIEMDTKNPDQKKIIIPAKTLQELLRILTQPEKVIDIYISENQILFSWEETELVSRIISGQYPDYKQIIPQNYKTKAIIDLDNFIKVIKGASLFSQLGLNDINLEFKPSENKIIVKAISNQIGENISEIEADIEGEKNNIVFNYRYLLDGLLNIDTPEVILEIIDNSTPGILKPIKGDDYIYVIMPIRQ